MDDNAVGLESSDLLLYSLIVSSDLAIVVDDFVAGIGVDVLVLREDLGDGSWVDMKMIGKEFVGGDFAFGDGEEGEKEGVGHDYFNRLMKLLSINSSKLIFSYSHLFSRNCLISSIVNIDT